MNTIGWKDNGTYSKHFFCEIASVGNPSDVVRGRIVSYSISSSNTFESALEGYSADGKFATTSALMQTGIIESIIGSSNPQLKGKTLVSLESSIQVWRGAEPLQVSLSLEFVAFQGKGSAYSQVDYPIQILHKMVSPFLNNSTALQALKIDSKTFSEGVSNAVLSSMGRVPFDIILDFMSQRFKSLYVLESVNEDTDNLQLDSNGNRVRQTVSLSFKSKRAILDNGEDIKFK